MTPNADYAGQGEDEECTNCDGKGRYLGWPHVTCPVCGGSGRVSPNGRSET